MIWVDVCLLLPSVLIVRKIVKMWLVGRSSLSGTPLSFSTIKFLFLSLGLHSEVSQNLFIISSLYTNLGFSCCNPYFFTSPWVCKGIGVTPIIRDHLPQSLTWCPPYAYPCQTPVAVLLSAHSSCWQEFNMYNKLKPTGHSRSQPENVLITCKSAVQHLIPFGLYSSRSGSQVELDIELHLDCD